MPQPRDILVITTAEPANKRIRKHLKPVTSHVVAGTNIFSDIFASWSDIFGGRSTSYQKQLTSLYNESVERLQYQAYQLGADCIVGLKIDIDEISGGGKSMLMITAIGTAAILEGEGEAASNGNILEGGVSFSALEDMKTRKTYIKKANEEVLELDSNIWEYLVRNKVSEVYPFLLKRFQKYFDIHGNYPSEEMQTFKEHFKTYLGNLQREDQINLIYKTLQDEQVGVLTRKLLFLMIENYNLFDFDEFWLLLKSESSVIKKRMLSILAFNKPYYTYSDIQEFENISRYISTEFKKEGFLASKKQMLSRKEVEVWECSCGKQNHLEVTHCFDCQKDIYGFYSEQTNPIEAEEIIQEKIDLIKRLLPKKEQSEVTTS